MPKKYLEDSAIKSENYSYYKDLFSDKELKDINYNLLLFNFMKLAKNTTDTIFLSCIEIILKEIPYNEEYHLPLAKLLCNNKYAPMMHNIIKYFLTKNWNDFENFIQNRPDILMLIQYYGSGAVDRVLDLNENSCQNRYRQVLNEIYNLKRADIAWCLELYKFDTSERIDILNHWARNNQVIAFDTYFEYFMNENQDYENVGKSLDEEFKNKMSEEPDTPLVRERVNKGKIDYSNLKSNNQ